MPWRQELEEEERKRQNKLKQVAKIKQQNLSQWVKKPKAVESKE
jgi:hypothetical protein